MSVAQASSESAPAQPPVVLSSKWSTSEVIFVAVATIVALAGIMGILSQHVVALNAIRMPSPLANMLTVCGIGALLCFYFCREEKKVPTEPQTLDVPYIGGSWRKGIQPIPKGVAPYIAFLAKKLEGDGHTVTKVTLTFQAKIGELQKGGAEFKYQVQNAKVVIEFHKPSDLNLSTTFEERNQAFKKLGSFVQLTIKATIDTLKDGAAHSHQIGFKEIEGALESDAWQKVLFSKDAGLPSLE